MPQPDTTTTGETTILTTVPILTLNLHNMSSSSSPDAAVRAVNKRFEGLLTVRTKAIKGKGAWYWAHLEPILVPHPDTGVPTTVKLKCSLCHSLFSASNPSRTASEHLKRGTCSNFASSLSSLHSPLPISSITPSSNHHHRKRPPSPPTSPHSYHHHHHHNNNNSNNNDNSNNNNNSLALVESCSFNKNNASVEYLNQSQSQNQSHLVLSGGKDDLSALAMFEDSVKKLKSPKTEPGPVLTKDQVNSAVDLLFDWFYECCGGVSLSAFESRKFQAFLMQVGLPGNLRKEVSGVRLDARFGELKAENEARIRDAMFFQVVSDGWKSGRNGNWVGFDDCCGGGESLVKFVVNLPNGGSVFQKVVFNGGVESSKYAEEVLMEAVREVTGTVVQRCVGIVADKFKAKALRNLELQHHWMVNTSCQLQGLVSLIKDFNRELPVFRNVIESCLKVASFIDNECQVRSVFLKCRAEEMDCGGGSGGGGGGGGAGLIRLPSMKCDPLKNFGAVFPMLEDVLSCARVIQMVVMDEGFKEMSMEDPLAREVAGMVQNEGFWNELEAVYSLVKIVRGMVQDVEAERPLIGRCLPLWEELRGKVKEWCGKYNIAEGPVEKIVEKRFRKNYHPAWAAAFILDPLYLIKDASGKYLPPFKCLTREQEKDVDKLLTRLASREEAHVVLMELMKWRSEGLDPLYAQAVQMKQRDPVTGKMKVANPLSNRLVWETCLSEFKSLGKIAVRLIFLHATSCGFKSNWSFIKKISANKHSRVAMERAQKIIYIAAHAKLERRDFSCEEEKDAELFATSGSEDGMLAEVYADASLM